MPRKTFNGRWGMKPWLKSVWAALNGHKRDIAGLYCANFVAFCGIWGISEHTVAYMILASIGLAFTAIGWAHAAAKAGNP